MQSVLNLLTAVCVYEHEIVAFYYNNGIIKKQFTYAKQMYLLYLTIYDKFPLNGSH